MDAQDLRDECLTIFLAGHETSASALASWGWCMAAHPQAQPRAADEVLALLSTKRVPEAADLPRLPGLALTIKETLRPAQPLWRPLRPLQRR